MDINRAETRTWIRRRYGRPPEAMTGMVPLSRFGEPKEVAEMVVLLVSDRGRWITMH
jgi:NAD(P)-dependent dehydrogenase (short-subunit alcohol dehydrogenase family)